MRGEPLPAQKRLLISGELQVSREELDASAAAFPGQIDGGLAFRPARRGVEIQIPGPLQIAGYPGPFLVSDTQLQLGLLVPGPRPPRKLLKRWLGGARLE